MPERSGKISTLISITLTKIKELNEFVHKKPPLGLLISYLSNSISPTGSKCGVVFGSLYDGNTFEIEFVYGYSNNKDITGLRFDLFDDVQPSKSIIKSELTFLSAEEVLKGNDSIPADIVNEYPSRVFIPVGLVRFYGVALCQADMEVLGIKSYFEAVQSILEIYHSISKGMELDSGLAELTKRQLQILEMIRKDLTNIAIANKLGYSESLIRQETISIYRKMGVHGRKDLIMRS